MNEPKESTFFPPEMEKTSSEFPYDETGDPLPIQLQKEAELAAVASQNWLSKRGTTVSDILQPDFEAAEVVEGLKSGAKAPSPSTSSVGESTSSTVSLSDGHVQAEPRVASSVESAPVNLGPPYQMDNATEPNDLEAGSTFNAHNEPRPADHLDKFEIILMLGSQLFSGTDTVWAQYGASEMSIKAKFLYYFFLACTCLGIICYWNSLFIYGFRRHRFAARLLLGTAHVATCSGVFATIGMKFPDELKLWVTGVCCTVCWPSVIGHAMKGLKKKSHAPGMRFECWTPGEGDWSDTLKPRF